MIDFVAKFKGNNLGEMMLHIATLRYIMQHNARYYE
jgi:hypothetical protein